MNPPSFDLRPPRPRDHGLARVACLRPFAGTLILILILFLLPLLLCPLAGCLGPEPPRLDAARAPDAPPRILNLRPAVGVGIGAPVALAVSAPVMLAGVDAPVRLRTASGMAVRAAIALGADGYEIDLAPAASWPPGDTIDIEIGTGFVGRTGLPLAPPTIPLTFRTITSTAPPEDLGSTPPASSSDPPRAGMREAVVRAPVPGRAAPVNLALVAVAITPTGTRGPDQVELLGDEGRVLANVIGHDAEGVWLARLPPFQADCDPLCSSTRYRVGIPEGIAAAASGPRGEVLTSTAVDLTPPIVTSSAVIVGSDQVLVHLELSEAVFVQTALSGPDGLSHPLPAPLVPSATFDLRTPDLLEPGTDYTLQVEGEDLAGNPLRPLSARLRTAPPLRVVVNEVVPSPLHDWNHSDGLGVPFSPTAGTGKVTSADQWIELVNLSAFAIDLTTAGLVLRKVDSSPTETPLGSLTEYAFGDGGDLTSWAPGEALVFHAKGSISRHGCVLELATQTRQLDRVALGEVPGTIAASLGPPDMRHESLARDASGQFRWCVPTPGDPLPPAACF